MVQGKKTGWALGLFAALVCSGEVSWALDPVGVPDDRVLAGVTVGKDGPREVERKWGPAPCLVPSLSGEEMSYLYHVPSAKGSSFLRLEVNAHVNAITISEDPPLTGVCYAPLQLPTPIRTGKGLHLGLTTEEVTNIYGKPVESFAVGSMMRFRYAAMLDRPYEWDLVFRNGRLVEWSVVTSE
jgi:hypothetical protein